MGEFERRASGAGRLRFAPFARRSYALSWAKAGGGPVVVALYQPWKSVLRNWYAPAPIGVEIDWGEGFRKVEWVNNLDPPESVVRTPPGEGTLRLRMIASDVLVDLEVAEHGQPLLVTVWPERKAPGGTDGRAAEVAVEVSTGAHFWNKWEVLSTHTFSVHHEEGDARDRRVDEWRREFLRQ